MRSAETYLLSPVTMLCGFSLLPVGNLRETSIYLWYIITGLDDKGVDAILGFTAVVFMLFQWIVNEFSPQVLMYRIYNFISGGLMISSLMLFLLYPGNHLGYHLLWPWSHIILITLMVLLIFFMIYQVKRFHTPF